jgi:hypothetical protein
MKTREIADTGLQYAVRGTDKRRFALCVCAKDPLDDPSSLVAALQRGDFYGARRTPERKLVPIA